MQWYTLAVNPDDIVIDERYQSRTGLNEHVVLEYAEAMSNGVNFPPLRLAKIDGTYFLVDGFHRVEAARQSENNIPFLDMYDQALVADCTHEEASSYSVTTNIGHGLRRSNADKRKAIALSLDLEDYKFLSDRELAKRLSVSPPLVAEVRKQALAQKGRIFHNAGKDESVKIFSRELSAPLVARPANETDTGEAKEQGPSPTQEAAELLEFERYDEHGDMVKDLSKEVDRLRRALASASFDGHEQERSTYETLLDERDEEINELYQKLHFCERQLDTAKASRDTYMNENADLKRQVKYWRRRAEKAEKAAAEAN